MNKSVIRTHCSADRVVLERIPECERRAAHRAEWLAGEYRAADHPTAHVHYDSTTDSFIVVAPAGGESK